MLIYAALMQGMSIWLTRLMLDFLLSMVWVVRNIDDTIGITKLVPTL